MNTIKNNSGFTLIEVLIAILISGILISGAFGFYSTMQSQTTIQMEMSNIQNITRASLDDISSTLRQAGYKLNGHDPYLINGDTLMVFFNIYNSVDTVTYFIAGQSGTGDYEPQESENTTYYLMKGCSYGTTSIYSDNIVSVNFVNIEDNIIRISITAQTEYPDDTYNYNNGYRTWTLSEDVCLRNI